MCSLFLRSIAALNCTQSSACELTPSLIKALQENVRRGDLEHIMAAMGSSNEAYQSLKAVINDSPADPIDRRNFQRMLDVLTQTQKQQDEYDRRWRNMSAYFKALPEDEKPKTLGGHRDILVKFGCDHCKKEGATIRCRQCGEWYCTRECQKADWPLHKRICKEVVARRGYPEMLDL